jgi:hypothetical protein
MTAEVLHDTPAPQAASPAVERDLLVHTALMLRLEIKAGNERWRGRARKASNAATEATLLTLDGVKSAG